MPRRSTLPFHSEDGDDTPVLSPCAIKQPLMHCVFCDIIRGAQPAEILVETKRVISFLDIHPIHPGHALVVPKVHSDDFLGLAADDMQELMSTAQTIARALVKGLGLSGFNIFSNNGRIAGQSVFHFHLHVTPRHPGDGFQFVHQLHTYASNEVRRYGDLIRTNLST